MEGMTPAAGAAVAERAKGGIPAIELDNVSLSFPRPNGSGELVIFDNFNLQVEDGSFTVILGPSGCGKSTLLNVVSGLLPPTQADGIRVFGQDLRQNPDITRKMAYVFQHARLLPWRTLRDNVVFALKGLGIQPREKWDELMNRYFEMVGLRDYMNYYPSQVSGGMQQRAAIVRAWVNEPRILLMDEPFSHLDEMTASTMRSELVNLWSREEPRRTVVFVTHDIGEAAELADRVLLFSKVPARILYDKPVALPRPRHDDDQAVFEVTRELKQALRTGGS